MADDGDAISKLTADDPLARSADSVAANLAALYALFPDAFTEGRVDCDVLRQLLGDAVEEGEERYGLGWSGKRQARRLALTPSAGTLLPAPEESVDWEKTRNLMFEGDNLEVLKLLQKSYAGKVKVIYIDPPYNTGNDFIYPDDYVDSMGSYLRRMGNIDDTGIKTTSNSEGGGRFHTNWLNMMYPRLLAAHSLLTKDGIMLFSIDDTEVANARMLLNSIFGEENFITSLTWDKSRKNDAKLFSTGHEYMLVYARSSAKLRERKTVWREGKPGTRAIWKQYVHLREIHGKDDGAIENALQDWFSALPKTDPAKKWSRYKRVDRNGPWRDRDISWPGGDGPRYDVLHPETGQPCKAPERGWIYADPADTQKQVQLKTVMFRKDHTEPPFLKFHLRPISEDLIDADELTDDVNDDEDELATQVRSSYIYKQAQVSVRKLRDLMGAKIFQNPKDQEELANIITYVSANDPDFVTLDFFAGSGTTGHAMMAQNAADDGNRRFILVQLPEPLDPGKKEQKAAADFCGHIGKPLTIAELTKERLRRAAAKIKSDHPESVFDAGFRVYKQAISNLKAWSPGEDLSADLLDAADNLLPGRTNDDLLVELLLKRGIDLVDPMHTRTVAGRTVHALGGGVLVVCLAPVTAADAEPLADGIAAWVLELDPPVPATLIFKDAGFADDVAKANLAATLRQRLNGRAPDPTRGGKLPNMLLEVRSV